MGDIFEDLLDGRRLLVQGLPRAGKSRIARLLVKQVGDTAVFASGRDFTESSQQ